MLLDLSKVRTNVDFLIAGEDGQKVRIVGVPKFNETGEIVLVNLSTLESEVVRFSSGNIKKEIEEDTNGDAEGIMDDIEELQTV
jgi:hypothetical protein